MLIFLEPQGMQAQQNEGVHRTKATERRCLQPVLLGRQGAGGWLELSGMSVTQVTAVSGLSSLRSPARAPEGLLCLQEQLARCSAPVTPVSPPHLMHRNSEPSAGFIVLKLSYSSLRNRVRSRARPKVCNLLQPLQCLSVFPFSSTKTQAWEEKAVLTFYDQHRW